MQLLLQIMQTIIRHMRAILLLIWFISRLEKDSSKLGHWFKFNYLKCTEDKGQLLMNVDYPDLFIKVGKENVHNSTQVKLLGIIFDTELNFDARVSKLCKKALSRVAKYMTKDKLRIVMNSFIISQFGYCPLVWMFHSRGVNNRIIKIHERTLWLVYKDDKTTFEELLMKDKSFTIHDRNLQVLATEIYQVINNISPAITNSIFQIKKTPYNLRGGINLCTNNVKTIKYGTETLSFRDFVHELFPSNFNLFLSRCIISSPCKLAFTAIFMVLFITMIF